MKLDKKHIVKLLRRGLFSDTLNQEAAELIEEQQQLIEQLKDILINFNGEDYLRSEIHHGDEVYWFDNSKFEEFVVSKVGNIYETVDR